MSDFLTIIFIYFIHFIELFLILLFAVILYAYRDKKVSKTNTSKFFLLLLNFSFIYFFLLYFTIHTSDYYYIPIKQNIQDVVPQENREKFDQYLKYIDSFNFEIAIPLNNSTNNEKNDTIIYNQLFKYSFLKVSKNNYTSYTAKEIINAYENFFKNHKALLSY